MSIKSKIRKVIKFFNAKEKVAIPTLTNVNQLLQGKTALITGGSSGIGFEIAKKFLEAGCKVVITGRNENKLNDSCQKLGTDNIKGIVLDLEDVDSLKQKIHESILLFSDSRIDILVNGAGFNPKKSFLEITEKDYDKTMNTNVKGTFFVSQIVAKYMIENKIKGHILNLSSSSALRPAWSPYEMSKWTLRGFTVGLADSLIPYGIIVNAIAPGPTATPMLGLNSGDDLDLSISPIGRYASPEEIANLALILVSEIGNLVVGDTLYATGGSGVISLHR